MPTSKNYFAGKKVNLEDISNINTEDHLAQNYIERQTIDNPNSIKPVTIDATNNKGIYLFILSDLHIGSRGANLLKLLRHLKQLQPLDNVYYIINGDLMNNAIPGSVSSQLKDFANPEESQKILIKVLNKYLPKDRNRVAIFATGNHENRTVKAAGVDPLKTVATALKVYHRFADHMYLIDFLVKSTDEKNVKNYRVFGRHGSGGGGSVGVALDKMFNLSNVYQDFDLVVEGHLHKNGQATKCHNTKTDAGVTTTKTVNAITANSYQEYGDYAASIALPPSDTDNFLHEILLVNNLDYENASRKQKSKHDKYVFKTNTICIDKFLLQHGPSINMDDLKSELKAVYEEVQISEKFEEVFDNIKEKNKESLQELSDILVNSTTSSLSQFNKDELEEARI